MSGHGASLVPLTSRWPLPRPRIRILEPVRSAMPRRVDPPRPMRRGTRSNPGACIWRWRCAHMRSRREPCGRARLAAAMLVPRAPAAAAEALDWLGRAGPPLPEAQSRPPLPRAAASSTAGGCAAGRAVAGRPGGAGTGARMVAASLAMCTSCSCCSQAAARAAGCMTPPKHPPGVPGRYSGNMLAPQLAGPMAAERHRGMPAPECGAAIGAATAAGGPGVAGSGAATCGSRPTRDGAGRHSQLCSPTACWSALQVRLLQAPALPVETSELVDWSSAAAWPTAHSPRSAEAHLEAVQAGVGGPDACPGAPSSAEGHRDAVRAGVGNAPRSADGQREAVPAGVAWPSRPADDLGGRRDRRSPGRLPRPAQNGDSSPMLT
mmetsp:Transcript_6166/g.16773  ORF Transcript_6166/g.16773 Transcript_6166/m.16773 type:complete len:378 (-) Transcript_6166:382-1515(-)